ncbi:MAG: hypothetical protein SFV81_06275 [Pirellulaceae bacterium]|nr:hypothetical protein [Pirellulaceae bacterium]
MISAASHSSVVTLELLVGERKIPLVQMSREYLISQTPVELPVTDAEILMHVDGKPTRMAVFLPDGCSLENRRFRIAPPRNQAPD